MAQLIKFLGILILCLAGCSTNTSVDEQLQELRGNYIGLKRVLETKVTELETEVSLLKGQLQRQESILNDVHEKSTTSCTCVSNKVNEINRPLPALTGLPSSCEDLSLIGHTLAGLYSVMGAQLVETVHCDFTKLPNEPGYQTMIGYSDIKSIPTFFYVQKNFGFNVTDTPIPFEVERLNIGGAMNLTSGIFTAPRTGIYFFSLSGFATIPPSNTRLFFGVGLYLNGRSIGIAWADEITPGDQDETYSLQSTLNLQAGDEVWLEIRFLSPGVYLNDRPGHFTHFTGWLLQEDIFQSL
ncbi:C1q and tumor necrosis factor-related protein-like protein 3 isoform b [Daphnia sinensis]|uniref:C1q and tumor necrosis factor-related protein-like protein 3 isoform b n=1 Tax=Daphnia sinensis TaxID=1820382 RepID=A0AAD5LJT5_9CRUS|nr:C1q and tumor necrosis factor-related protein-like protein 3 isoform b [Daphnia sinensis]